MDLKLSGRTALVTGSSKGIGAAIVRRLAEEGATVLVHGRDGALATTVAAEIRANGGAAYVVGGDLTRDEEVQAMVDDARRQVGHVDILVNNAGGSGGSKGPWGQTTADAWAAAYDRNVLAAIRVTSRLIPHMQQARWGRVVNISSLAGAMPPAASPDYSACKAAINAMTASLAKAMATDGVTVNAISPGTIHSEALDARFREVAEEKGLAALDAPWAEVEQAVLPLFARVPLGRVGEPEEIANIVAFLASPLAGYVTGVNLRVDGGLWPGL